MARDFASKPILQSKLITREVFETLQGGNPVSFEWSINLHGDDIIFVTKAHPPNPRRLMFVRKRGEAVDRVEVYDVDGVLRIDAEPADATSIAEDVYAAAEPEIAKYAEAREQRIAHAIASSPNIDRRALEECVTALSGGRIDIAPVVNAVMFACADPWTYARSAPTLLVKEPAVGLHLHALRTALPESCLVGCDYKENMREVAPQIVDMFELTRGIRLDVSAIESQYPLWDKYRSPKKAVREIATSIADFAIVELKDPETDELTFFSLPRSSVKQLPTWKRKAAIPLAVLK